MKYGLIGAGGRMGQEIQSLFSENGHDLVYFLDIDNKNQTGIPEVLIDFSLSEALEKTIQMVGEFNCPLVTGVTGYSEEQSLQIQQLAEQFAVVQSGNYSIGIQMMLKMAEFMNSYLSNWDIEINETHHRFKKDKPSGTAKMLAKMFDGDIPIHSQRIGNIPGDHTITMAGMGETISLTHRALSRRTFAEGVLTAAEFVINKETGLYSFTDVLFKVEG